MGLGCSSARGASSIQPATPDTASTFPSFAESRYPDRATYEAARRGFEAGKKLTYPSDPWLATANASLTAVPFPTEWEIHKHAMFEASPVLRALIDSLSAGDERHAECCICCEALHERECVAFTHGGKRTCSHVVHKHCANELLASCSHGDPHCPLCRKRIDAHVGVPNLLDDPAGWFRVADADGDGKLSCMEVSKLLVAQFSLDDSKCDEALPALWSRWDADADGYLSAADFVDAKRGLLSFVRTHLSQGYEDANAAYTC